MDPYERYAQAGLSPQGSNGESTLPRSTCANVFLQRHNGPTAHGQQRYSCSHWTLSKYLPDTTGGAGRTCVCVCVGEVGGVLLLVI